MTSLLSVLFVTVHWKANFLVNMYCHNKYSDSDKVIWGSFSYLNLSSHIIYINFTSHFFKL